MGTTSAMGLAVLHTPHVTVVGRSMPFKGHSRHARRLNEMPQVDDTFDGGLRLRRESLWYVASETPDANERRGRFVAEVWTALVYPGTLTTFERLGLPLLQAMRGVRASRVAVVRLTDATFLAGDTRRLIENAALIDVTVMVELAGPWSAPALEVLAAIRPSFVRIPLEYTAGASTVPEQARRLSQLSDCMMRASVPLVAQGPLAPDDDAAVRAAGIDLRVITESGGEDLAWPEAGSLGAVPAPVVLPFPLRPSGR